MKKSLLMFLALSLLIAVFTGCTGNNDGSETTPSKITSSEITPRERGFACLDEGKYEEAYKCFYEIKNEEGIDDILAKFEILASKTVKYTSSATTVLSEITENTYDSNGNVLVKKLTHKDGSVNTTEFEYNEKGKMTSYILYGLSDKMLRVEVDYDSDGRLLEYRRYDDPDNPDDVLVLQKYEYNKNGDKIKETVTDYATRSTTHRETEYNSFGNPIRATSITDDGNLYTTTWTYDDNQNIIKLEDEAENSYNYTVYAYDGANNLIKSEVFESNGRTSVTENEYDSENNIKRTVSRYNIPDEFAYTAFDEKVYDTNGNIVKHTEIRKTGKIEGTSVVEYEYDENGNNTVEDNYFDGEFSHGVRRTYNQDGDLIYVYYVDQDEAFTKREEYTYDDKGNCIKYRISDKVMKCDTIYEYTRDDLGNLLKETLTYTKEYSDKIETETIAEYSGFVYIYSDKE